MTTEKKMVVYETTNAYHTLNLRTKNTKNTWFVCHGMGYLSRFFLKHFYCLDSEENYIIAPQAPSKYYLKDDYKHVGASWLTREDTFTEISNVMQFLGAVYASERLFDTGNTILFGFSQGVSIVMRWVVRSQVNCSKIVLYAGSIPNEIRKEDLIFLDYQKTKIFVVYGDKDPFLSDERIAGEKQKIDSLFEGHATIIRFQGGHEIIPEVLQQIVAI